MQKKDRRICQRYKMDYPIIISSPRGIENDEGWHYGEILDAGSKGIRLRVANFGSLPIGTKLQLICQPASDHMPNNKCMPVPIEGMVVWKDVTRDEFALTYIH